jgi:hypothetical protein
MNNTAPFGQHSRVELTCLYCGHALGEVLVPRGRRPTNAELRGAYASEPDAIAPAWDAHGAPRCPRCAARLFIEFTDRSSPRHVPARVGRRHAPAATPEEREDGYAREDVYVGEPEIAD